VGSRGGGGGGVRGGGWWWWCGGGGGGGGVFPSAPQAELRSACGGTCQFKFKFFKFNIGAHIFWIILEFNWHDEFINFEDMPTQSFVGAHRDRIAHVYLYE